MQSMNSSSAPAPSICGFARMTTRSPLAIGVAASRDSSVHACMHPLRMATPRHAVVMQIALFMDLLPGRDAGCLLARQVCHVAASSLCDLVARVVVPNLTQEPQFTASDPATTEDEYVVEAERDSFATKFACHWLPGESRACGRQARNAAESAGPPAPSRACASRTGGRCLARRACCARST